MPHSQESDAMAMCHRRGGSAPLIRALSLVMFGTLSLGLAGCNADAQPKPTPSVTTEAQPGITDITDTPGSGENLVGALADTEVSTCEAADGQWNVAGTVTNPTDAAASYRIYVSLLTDTGATRALTQVNVDDLAAGAATEWSTKVDLDESKLECVLRVERYGPADEDAPGDDQEGEGEG